MLKRFLSLAIAAGCLVTIGVAVPAFAQNDNAPDRPVSSQDSGGGTSGNAGDAPARARDIADRARDRSMQIRNQAQARTAQLRTDVCERKEQQLNQLMPGMSRRATALLTAMDAVYGRVQQFYETGQLTVDNYDELKAGVDTAQTEAAAAVQTLQDYEFDLNCDDRQAGGDLDSFRLSAGEAKESLKAYRAELVNLISAMRAAAASTDTAEEQ